MPSADGEGARGTVAVGRSCFEPDHGTAEEAAAQKELLACIEVRDRHSQALFSVCSLRQENHVSDRSSVDYE